MDGGIMMKARVVPMRYRSPSVACQASIMMKATSLPVSCSRRMRWGEGCVGLGVKTGATTQARRLGCNDGPPAALLTPCLSPPWC